MMKEKIIVILRRTILILLIFVLFIGVSKILERKTIDGAWNYSLKVNGFKNEIEDSIDIIGFGSSHMYCTLNPVHIYNETGIRSYVLATQQQPVEAMYYYMKEALKTQSPEVLVVEALMFTVTSDVVAEGVAHDAVDPFPDGWNKIQMINALNTEDAKENYYLNILKYHSRWKELTKQDFDFGWKKETDPMHGYVFLTDAKPNNVSQLSYDAIEEIKILPKYQEYFLKMVNLAKENNTEMLLLVAPYHVDSSALGYYKYLHQLAEENGVKVLDLNQNFESTNISNETDFYDAGHLNVYGAEKASSYILDFILNNYNVEGNKIEDEALWQEDIKYYHSILQ